MVKRKTMKKTFYVVVAASLLTFILSTQVRGLQASNRETLMGEEAQAEIKFDTLKHDFGSFSVESAPEQKCTFTFTNVGNAPLIIQQAFASCGCTVPTYTKDPIKPGEKGQVDVTYNGKGKQFGKFSKTITIRSNAKTEIVRLSIEGMMTR